MWHLCWCVSSGVSWSRRGKCQCLSLLWHSTDSEWSTGHGNTVLFSKTLPQIGLFAPPKNKNPASCGGPKAVPHAGPLFYFIFLNNTLLHPTFPSVVTPSETTLQESLVAFFHVRLCLQTWWLDKHHPLHLSIYAIVPPPSMGRWVWQQMCRLPPSPRFPTGGLNIQPMKKGLSRIRGRGRRAY